MSKETHSHSKPIICIGAALVDDSFYCLNKPLPGTSNPATHYRSAGGVARNVSHHLAQLGNPVELIAHFGLDAEGDWLREVCSSVGIGLSRSVFSKTGTGHFSGIISPDGELFAGASDTHLEQEITISLLSSQSSFLAGASLLLCDCNLEISCIRWIIDFCSVQNIPCIIEPVSVAKASLLRNVNLNSVLLISPNTMELAALTGNQESGTLQESVEHLLKRGVQNIWIRNGKDGSEFFSQNEHISLPAPEVHVIDSTGAGDAALAGWIHARHLGKSPRECILYGHAMAQIILQTNGTYAESLDETKLESIVTNLKSL